MSFTTKPLFGCLTSSNEIWTHTCPTYRILHLKHRNLKIVVKCYIHHKNHHNTNTHTSPYVCVFICISSTHIISCQCQIYLISTNEAKNPSMNAWPPAMSGYSIFPLLIIWYFSWHSTQFHHYIAWTADDIDHLGYLIRSPLIEKSY